MTTRFGTIVMLTGALGACSADPFGAGSAGAGEEVGSGTAAHLGMRMIAATPEAHAQRAASRAGQPAAFTAGKTLSYAGGVDGVGVTSGSPKVYLIFYGSQWGAPGFDASGNLTLSNDAFGAAPYLQNMYRGLGTGGERWSGVMTQYCDGPLVASGATACPNAAPRVGYPAGTALAGVWYDSAAPSPAVATLDQLAAEAIRAAQHFGNTTPTSNRYAQYVVFSPTGTHPGQFGLVTPGFCAWHFFTASTLGDIAYTNLPYVNDIYCGQGWVNGSTAQGQLDSFSIVAGHEYAETLTDQFPNGGWITSDPMVSENGDDCAWISSGQGAISNVTMATGTFAMQSTWSNDTDRCEIAHPIVRFTPIHVPPGTLVPGAPSLTLSGTSSTIDTSALTVNGATSAFFVHQGNAAVLFTDLFAVAGPVLITGTSPLIVVANREVTINSTISLGAIGTTPGPGAPAPGTGSGDGGAGATFFVRAASARESSGGGGGSYGTLGNSGGTRDAVTIPGGSGGAGYGVSTSDPLIGGSAGGVGGLGTTGAGAGGAGGGALQISSAVSISVTAAGKINAGGAGGRGGSTGPVGGGGGGAGGEILLEAPSLTIAGTLAANGGGGGGGGAGLGPVPGLAGASGSADATPAAGGVAGVPQGSPGGTGAAGVAGSFTGAQAAPGSNSEGGGGGGGAGRIWLRFEAATPPTLTGSVITPPAGTDSTLP